MEDQFDNDSLEHKYTPVKISQDMNGLNKVQNNRDEKAVETEKSLHAKVKRIESKPVKQIEDKKRSVNAPRDNKSPAQCRNEHWEQQ